MQLDGDWIIQYIRDYKPDWKYPDDFGIAALPWATGKEKPGGASNVLRTYPLVLVKNTQHPQEAWDFISWLQSPDVTVKISKYLINLPQSTAALSDPNSTGVPGFGTILEAFRTSHNIKSLPAMPASAEFADSFEKEITLAFHGKEAVDAALQKVAGEIELGDRQGRRRVGRSPSPAWRSGTTPRRRRAESAGAAVEPRPQRMELSESDRRGGQCRRSPIASGMAAITCSATPCPGWNGTATRPLGPGGSLLLTRTRTAPPT